VVTVPSFQAAFLEFRETDSEIVAACIARAQRWVSASRWGTLTDDGVSYLAAHFLAIDPSGTSTALIPTKDRGEGDFCETTYGVMFMQLRKSVILGAMSWC
jgi:hypothetical protein